MQRRKFMQGVVAGSAALVSSGAMASPAAARAPSAGPESAPEVPESLAPMLEPLRVGDGIGLGWSLTAMTPVECGAAVLSLSRATTKQQVNVHVCRHEGEPCGAAHSQTLDFVLMNRGDGATLTDESLGRVLNVLSDLASRNEQAGRRPPAALETHEERIARFGVHGAMI